MTKDDIIDMARQAGFVICRDEDPINFPEIFEFAKLVAEKAQETKDEPVAFEKWHKENYVQDLERYGDTYKNNHVRCRHQGWLGAQAISLQRTWVGLTDEDMGFLFPHGKSVWVQEIVKIIENKLKEKNT